jgi:hypothetical protein
MSVTKGINTTLLNGTRVEIPAYVSSLFFRGDGEIVVERRFEDGTETTSNYARIGTRYFYPVGKRRSNEKTEDKEGPLESVTEESITCTLVPVVQDHQEIITCAYNPITKVWKCWSIAQLPWERRKFEMLEVCGRKFSNEFELLGFKPETGNTVGVQFTMDVLLKQMIEMLQSHLAER